MKKTWPFTLLFVLFECLSLSKSAHAEDHYLDIIFFIFLFCIVNLLLNPDFLPFIHIFNTKSIQFLPFYLSLKVFLLPYYRLCGSDVCNCPSFLHLSLISNKSDYCGPNNRKRIILCYDYISTESDMGMVDLAWIRLNPRKTASYMMYTFGAIWALFERVLYFVEFFGLVSL